MTYDWYGVEYEKDGQLMYTRSFAESAQEAARLVLELKGADVIVAVNSK